jgi:hypothetical protein
MNCFKEICPIKLLKKNSYEKESSKVQFNLLHDLVSQRFFTVLSSARKSFDSFLFRCRSAFYFVSFKKNKL